MCVIVLPHYISMLLSKSPLTFQPIIIPSLKRLFSFSNGEILSPGRRRTIHLEMITVITAILWTHSELQPWANVLRFHKYFVLIDAVKHPSCEIQFSRASLWIIKLMKVFKIWAKMLTKQNSKQQNFVFLPLSIKLLQ